MIDDNFLSEKLFKNIPGNFDNILWVHVGSILKTTYYKQEDVSPFLNHLYSVNIATSNVEETPNILKYLDENKSEFIQGKLNT